MPSGPSPSFSTSTAHVELKTTFAVTGFSLKSLRDPGCASRMRKPGAFTKRGYGYTLHALSPVFARSKRRFEFRNIEAFSNHRSCSSIHVSRYHVLHQIAHTTRPSHISHTSSIRHKPHISTRDHAGRGSMTSRSCSSVQPKSILNFEENVRSRKNRNC